MARNFINLNSLEATIITKARDVLCWDLHRWIKLREVKLELFSLDIRNQDDPIWSEHSPRFVIPLLFLCGSLINFTLNIQKSSLSCYCAIPFRRPSSVVLTVVTHWRIIMQMSGYSFPCLSVTRYEFPGKMKPQNVEYCIRFVIVSLVIDYRSLL